jgi:MFS family permease
MTGFAIGIWIFEQTGRSTDLALVGVSALVPTLIFTLFSGIIVDRFNRKRLMIAGDTVAGCSTIVLLLLFTSGNLQIWHLYVAYAVNAPFDRLQALAYQTSATLIVSKKHYTRVSSMATLTWYAGNILSPIFATALYAAVGLMGVMVADIVTFLIAIITVLVSRVPQPPLEESAKPFDIRQQLAYGFRYIWRQPALRALVLVACLWTLFHDATPQTAMIMARTGNNEAILAAVAAASGVGGIAASVVIGVWGGPKRRMLTYGWGMVSAGIGKTLMGVGNGVSSWAPTQAYTSANFPALLSARRAILMAKVAPGTQGRFFASFSIATGLVSLFTQSLKGPLGDFVFEPAMADGGVLVPYLGWLFGTGTGAGFAVQFALLGLGMTGVGVLALLWGQVRDIETTLRDYDHAAQPAADH